MQIILKKLNTQIDKMREQLNLLYSNYDPEFAWVFEMIDRCADENKRPRNKEITNLIFKKDNIYWISKKRAIKTI